MASIEMARQTERSGVNPRTPRPVKGPPAGDAVPMTSTNFETKFLGVAQRLMGRRRLRTSSKKFHIRRNNTIARDRLAKIRTARWGRPSPV